ncbi:MAG: glycerol-3-phosphate dehydrogenase [Pseudomonadota bacterium]
MIGQTDPYDLCIIGGGVNGCGIARDAAGRGLRVLLCEKSDLGGATSSASTKLFHGGLRYLEFYEFRLVREALKEREVLLSAMPHISWPMRFVLPHHKGLRPSWLLRLGLFLYDHMGGRKILPPTKTLDLSRDAAGEPLKDSYTKGFEYSDCWVEDSRLVVLNARDAADRGAVILPRMACVSASVEEGAWRVTLQSPDKTQSEIRAKAIVNAAGPWVEELTRNKIRLNTSEKVRLVRGSHIVVKRLFEHDRAYIFQQSDGRVVFAIPYERDFTLIGTTDADHEGDPSEAVCTPEEADYLRAAASEYFKAPITPEQIVWTYSGVRPLYDDGASSATQATRDYVLKLERPEDAPLLNIFGGKITTYRKLAEEAMDRLDPVFPQMSRPWTAGVPLPGGDFPVADVERLAEELRQQAPALDPVTALRLVRAYGTQASDIVQGAQTRDALGEDFGHGLYEREVQWLIDREWAIKADDVLWRRSKLGLRLSAEQAARLAEWMAKAVARRNEPKVA